MRRLSFLTIGASLQQIARLGLHCVPTSSNVPSLQLVLLPKVYLRVAEKRLLVADRNILQATLRGLSLYQQPMDRRGFERHLTGRIERSIRH